MQSKPWVCFNVWYFKVRIMIEETDADAIRAQSRAVFERLSNLTRLSELNIYGKKSGDGQKILGARSAAGKRTRLAINSEVANETLLYRYDPERVGSRRGMGCVKTGNVCWMLTGSLTDMVLTQACLCLINITRAANVRHFVVSKS